MTESNSTYNPYAAPAAVLPEGLISGSEIREGVFGRAAAGVRFVSASVILSTAAVVLVALINLSVRGKILPEDWMRANIGILAAGFGLAWLMALAGCLACLELPPAANARRLLLTAAVLHTSRTLLAILWANSAAGPIVFLASVVCGPGASLLFLSGLGRIAAFAELPEQTHRLHRVRLLSLLALCSFLLGTIIFSNGPLTYFSIVVGSVGIALAFYYSRVLSGFSKRLHQRQIEEDQSATRVQAE